MSNKIQTFFFDIDQFNGTPFSIQGQVHSLDWKICQLTHSNVLIGTFALANAIASCSYTSDHVANLQLVFLKYRIYNGRGEL